MHIQRLQSACAQCGSSAKPTRVVLVKASQSQRNTSNAGAQQVEEPLARSRRHVIHGLLAGSLISPIVSTITSHPARASLVEEDISTRLYATAGPSVVSIVNYRVDRTGAEVSTGVGTGVVWDSYGHIVTNYHCISRLDKSTDVTKILVTDASGREQLLPSQLVAMDTMNDLAVLQVVGDDAVKALQPAKFGSSVDIRVGQSVFAIGSPYGLSKTLSAGVVSGLNRAIPSPVGTRIYGAIQTDAQVNAGNSGGPLLDSSGAVIGINTATFTRSGTGRGSGVNFALPIDTVRAIVPKLIVYGNAMGKRV